MKVALIHDHLAQDGGAEKVLKELADIYPEAPIYTLLYEDKLVNKYFKNRNILTSIIQRLPGGVRFYQWYLPLMPVAVELFDLRDFDLVISNSSAFAKGIITSQDSLHICYCHTPTRYLWDYTHQYINELHCNKYLKKIISLVLNHIRMWDKLAADRVDFFIANSKTVQKRIAKFYKQDSKIIFPPVEVEKFYISEKIGDYFLAGARLSPYKRIDILVEAFKSNGKKLRIFGEGVDLKRLRKLAGNVKNIEFLGRISDNERADLYSHCLAFLHPQDEDFGITAVEAMASGRPVIAYRKGGATETVIENKTGLFFDKQEVGDILDIIDKFKKENFHPEEIKLHASIFSSANFKKNMQELVTEKYYDFINNR
jgi:glycosyltransferase involved in cell wall biosynthesis